jgi:hypothetical protein
MTAKSTAVEERASRGIGMATGKRSTVLNLTVLLHGQLMIAAPPHEASAPGHTPGGSMAA